MGQVPVLNYKGQELIQSLTIARFVARKCDLAGKTEIDEFLADQTRRRKRRRSKPDASPRIKASP